MHAVGERFRHIYPDYMDKTESIAVVSMRDAIVGNIGKTLYVLFGAVAFVYAHRLHQCCQSAACAFR